jgi:transposase
MWVIYSVRMSITMEVLIMRDIDVFTKLLALERPWTVDHVTLDAEAESLTIFLRHRSNARFRCPECNALMALYDHVPERRWRHLDHGSWRTWLAARLPRVSCLFHGIRQVDIPWALPGARCSLDFEKHAIDTLLEADVLGASRLLRISWDEAWAFMERAVRRGMQAKKRRVIAHLGVDEKAVARRHQYVTLVSDLDRGTVEFIADDRKKISLDAYYQSLTVRQLAGIRAIAMDMWEPFINSTRENVPQAAGKIVFDRFHVMKHMIEAVDAVRKAEHRRLLAEGDETLKRTKYLWLFSEEHLPERYLDWFARLKALSLKTGRAWAIKESLRDLWLYRRKGWAKRFWHEWYYWATHSRLKPVIKVARMLHSHLDNVLTYCDHRITNATSEGLNSKIQTVKKTPTVFETAST